MSKTPSDAPLPTINAVNVMILRHQGIPSIVTAVIRLKRVRTTCFRVSKSKITPPATEMGILLSRT